MAWKTLQEPLFPWARTVDRIIAAEDPPTMAGSTTVIASDYSGIDSRSRYRVDAYLCMDLDASRVWETARRQIRSHYLADGRRMSYKRLSDRRRAEALVPFLSAAKEISGICLITVFNKNLRNLCLRDVRDYNRLRKIANLQGRWKDHELEEAVRITHLVACLVGGLSQPGQNIYWISDEDSLLGNPKRSGDVARLLSSFSSHYVHHPLGELGIGTTALDEGDRLEEDLTAVADLVAGAVAETTNRLAEHCGGKIPAHLAVEYTKDFLPKAELIAHWLWMGGGQLRRVAILFERHAHGQYSVSRHGMAG